VPHPETDAEKIARLERENEQLRQEVARLRQDIEQLRRALDKALRAAKRQAAPFSRGAPKSNPKKPGRKAGRCYGRKAHRAIPRQVDETLEAELPFACPGCGGSIAETEVADQYQTEIPKPRVQHIRFRVHVGCCRRCGQRLQGRHPRQTSDALGSAASQLGPHAVALATQLNKGLGLPYGKTAQVLKEGWGLEVTRSGVCQAIARTGRKAEPTYQKMVQQVRASPAVTPDETGWKVGGRLWWLWAFATPGLTVYAIQPGRGFEQAATVLGENYAGTMTRDGWIVYLRFVRAVHQTCLTHLIRRSGEMMEVATPTAARFPRTVKDILQAALKLRDRRDAGQIGEPGLAVLRGRLEARLDRALERRYRSAANERFANHLYRERNYIFTFLYYPGLDAANWRGEQAIRPAVVARKVWGGNRTPQGAHTQEILTSVLQTCHQQKRPAAALLVGMLCAPIKKTWNLLAPVRSSRSATR
jgi:transposase